MKDHEKRELVNELTAIAKEFSGTQQLRERIAHCVLPAMDTFSAQVHLEMRKLAAVTSARDALLEAAKVRCTCSGFVIQYEGGCCCESGKGKRAAEDRLKQAIDAL